MPLHCCHNVFFAFVAAQKMLELLSQLKWYHSQCNQISVACKLWLESQASETLISFISQKLNLFLSYLQTYSFVST